MSIVVSIGTQDFEKLRKNNSFYIDKTDLIKEWWENQDDVTLITRPRRFGKTLNLNMLNCFFSNQYTGRGDLFENLSIWKEDTYRNLQGTYPVIFLSFANMKGVTYEAAREGIIQLLVKLYGYFSFVRDADFMTKQDLEYFDSVNLKMTDTTAAFAVYSMTDFLNRYYHKKVLIFLDEYDTPLQEAFIHGYWYKLAGFMRNIFNSTFKTNPFMERALLTGITRVSKESIFSDLNNLEVVTTTSKKYQTAFGFTEEEVYHSLEKMNLTSHKEQVKLWYNGFTFGNQSDIYNPWSITKFLDSGQIGTYWADTSENALVSDLIQEGTPQIKMQMEDLLFGKYIEVELEEQVVFEQLRRKKGAIWSLLLSSGYLKAVNMHFDIHSGKSYYQLGITNHETMLIFKNMIEGWFPEEEESYNHFQEALLLGDLDYMNQFMNEVAQQTFSSFDTGKRPSGKADPERFYHGFVLGLIVELANDYHITSNRESGFGRYDVMMEPKNPREKAFILEFKVFDPKKEKNLEETVENALRQIKSKSYDTELITRGISKENIYYYGFAFEGKKVLIG